MTKVLIRVIIYKSQIKVWVTLGKYELKHFQGFFIDVNCIQVNLILIRFSGGEAHVFLSVCATNYNIVGRAVVECLTRDRGAAGLSLTGPTALRS